MKSLYFSPAAEIDIETIWDYSAANWGPNQADRYTDDIRDSCQALADGTKRGRGVDIRAGYLKLKAGSHMIFFREASDRIEIIRILHSSQDTNRHI
jgi:toxin ParE1/3/4